MTFKEMWSAINDYGEDNFYEICDYLTTLEINILNENNNKISLYTYNDIIDLLTEKIKEEDLAFIHQVTDMVVNENYDENLGGYYINPYYIIETDKDGKFVAGASISDMDDLNEFLTNEDIIRLLYEEKEEVNFDYYDSEECEELENE